MKSYLKKNRMNERMNDYCWRIAWMNEFLLWIIFLFVYLFCVFLHFYFIDFDGYYIVRTDEGLPRPKYIFNKCGTNIYFFTLQRFGPSPSPNFKSKWMNDYLWKNCMNERMTTCGRIGWINEWMTTYGRIV